MASVYVMVAAEEEGPSYFKIGYSESVEKRAVNVQTGCPFPLREILFIVLEDVRTAKIIESRLHLELRPYHSCGEWFKFDLADPMHKKAFNDGVKKVITPIVGEGWTWARCSIDAIRKLALRIAAENRLTKRVSKDKVARRALSELRRIAAMP